MVEIKQGFKMTMDKAINILLIEDLTTDQILLKRHILKKIPNAIFTVADNRESFRERLNWNNYDIIVSDYNLPDFNGLEALLEVKASKPHTPFLFVTATLNDEEKAANSILKGASGYLLKQNMDQIGEQLIAMLEESQEANKMRKEKEDVLLERMRLMQKLQAKAEQIEDKKRRHELLSLVSELKNYV